ncbi:MAG: hypothetical protein ACOH1V_14720, partial [Stenotrophomonas sp.]
TAFALPLLLYRFCSTAFALPLLLYSFCFTASALLLLMLNFQRLEASRAPQWKQGRRGAGV